MHRLRRAAAAALITNIALACAPSAPPAVPGPEPDAGHAAGPEPEPAAALAVAVLLPLSAPDPLPRYGELILEGARLAAARFEEETGRRVELDVLDDAGDPARGAELVRSAEVGGGFGVVGPLLSDVLAEGAAARATPGFVLVSPTAADLPAHPNVYSLGTDEPSGAAALARYAVAAGLTRLAVLHPATAEHGAKAKAFADAAASAGASVLLTLAYDSGATTFAAPLAAIAGAQPQALFVPAPARDVVQIAPQLGYYGLRAGSLQVLGDEGWLDPETRRGVPAEFLDGTIVATPLRPRLDAGPGREFVERYEAAYRRTLDNPFPGFGHDAMLLLLAAAADAAGPSGVAARLAGRTLEGATAVLAVEGGRLVRRPFLLRVQGGDVVAAPSPADYEPPAPLFVPVEPDPDEEEWDLDGGRRGR
jgi:ABC-type branched-subunit amino acid transport system substrate-binding protein